MTLRSRGNFHRDYGHVTDDYKDLKDGIEDLIQRGNFKQYQPETDQERSPRVDNVQTWSVKERINEIHVISGGPIHSGSIDGAKANLKEVRHQVNYHNTGQWPAPPAMSSVAFTADDTKGVIYPHDDPLVVSLHISNAMVHRILGDGGSSANILFMPTFEKISLGNSNLKSVTCPVNGFIWAFAVPQGTIRLSVKLGEGSQSRDLLVEFLVVNVPATYNTIIR